MKKISALFLIAILAAIYISRGNYDNPVNGSTGAPGEGLCTDCHTTNPDITGVLELTGLPEEILQGETYNLSITTRYTSGNPTWAGFQVVILNEDGDNAGNMTRPGGANSGIISSGGRTYFEHKIGPTKLRADSTVTWTLEWIAPEGDLGKQVTIYGAGILGDGDTTELNDRQITATLSGVIVDQPTQLSAELLVEDISCHGASDGSLTVDVAGGMQPYSYLWNTEDTGPLLSGLSPGAYSVTVTDADSTEVVLDAELTDPDTLVVELVDKADIFCMGINTGFIEVAVSGGEGPYAYSWSNGGDVEIINNLGAGTYTLTLTDNRNCQVIFEENINASNALSLVISSTDESELGAGDGTATIEISGGVGPYLVVWNTGDTTETITGLSPGEYNVIVSDQNGCISQTSTVVNPGNCLLEIESAVQEISCAGFADGAVMLTASNGTGTISYNWSTGDSTPVLSGLGPGSYAVTVSDEGGCLVTANFDFSESSALSVNLSSVSDAQCESGTDGAIQIDVNGGQLPYTIDWSNGMTGDSIGGLQAGTYRAVVVDASGCADSLEVDVGAEDNVAPLLNTRNVVINLDATGSATISFADVDDGTGDNCGLDTVFVDRTFFDCSHLGTFNITATAIDLSGNVSQDSVSITVRDTIPPQISCIEGIISRDCDGVVYPLPQAEDNCAIDTFILVDGLGVGASFPLGETIERYLVLDNSGNGTMCSFAIIVETDLALSFDQVSACPGDSTGVITLSATGGKGEVSYIWSTGSTAQQIDSLVAGTYSVTVTDAEACVVVDSVTLSEATLPTVEVIQIVDASEEMLGSIDIEISGGYPPYRTVWISAADTASMAEDLVSAEPGQYELHVTDSLGCSVVTENFEIGGTTGIPVLEPDGLIKVYPNPFSEILHVRLERDMEIEDLFFSNLQGMKIHVPEFEHRGREITLRHSLQPGLYVLHVVTPEGIIVQSLVSK